MNKFKSYFRLSALAALWMTGSYALVSCDDDKFDSTDYEEVFVVNEITFDVTPDLPLPVDMDTTIAFSITAPEGADTTVKFFSSNEAVATVDQNGTITGVSEGQAVITCTLPIGFGPSATVNVNVVPELIAAQQINVKNTTSLGEEGKIYETDEIQLSAEILPANHTYSRLVWRSSDESIATVDDSGLVKCLKKGTAIISAFATDRSQTKGSWQITIDEYIAVEKIEITQPTSPVQILGGPFELDVTYFPEKATIGSVTWETSDPAVATVHRGVVTPHRIRIGFDHRYMRQDRRESDCKRRDSRRLVCLGCRQQVPRHQQVYLMDLQQRESHHREWRMARTLPRCRHRQVASRHKAQL